MFILTELAYSHRACLLHICFVYRLNGDRFIFFNSKITADGDCSLEIKRHLLLGKKVMTTLNSVLKSRGITLVTKAHVVKVIVFPVVIHGYDNWSIQEVECWRIDTCELWCWKLLRVTWTTIRSNQSILKEINPEYSLENCCWSWSSNTLTTWCEELIHWKIFWCQETLKTKGEGECRG